MAVGAQGIKAGRAYVEIGTHDKYIAGLRNAQRRLKAFGSAVRAVGKTMIKVGAMMAVPFAGGAKAYATFDQQMRMVSTMLGDAAGKWMPVFSRAAKKMAMEFGQSIESIAKGMYDLLSAQVPPAQMLGVLRAAMKAAIGGMTDTATAVKAVVRIMRGFGIEGSRAVDITDVLATIVEKGVITFEELAETIGTVAPTAKAAGMSLDQLAAAVATVVAVEEPARAMTALRTAIFEAAEEGMDFLAFVRKFKGADLGAIIQAGIPKKAAQGIVILAQNIDLLDKNLAALANRAGAAEEKFKKMAGGLTYSWNQLKAVVWVTFTEIGEAIEAPLAAAAAVAKKVGKIVGGFIQKNRGWVSTIAQVSVSIFAVGAALIVFSIALKTVSFTLGIAVGAFKLVGIAIVVAKAAFLALIPVLALMLNPMAMIVTALGVMAAYMVASTKAGGDALDWLGGKFTKLRNWVVDMVGGIVDALSTGDLALAAEIAWLGIKLAWANGIGGLETLWLTFATGIQAVFWMAAKGIAQAAIWIGRKVEGVWSEFAHGLDAIGAWMEKSAVNAVLKVEAAFEGIDPSGAIAANESRYRKNVIGIKKNMDAELAKSDAFYDKAAARVQANYEREMAALGKGHAAGTDAITAAMEKAQGRLDAAVAAAKKKRKEFEADTGEGPEGPPDPQAIIDRIKKQVYEGTKAAQAAVSVTGTFSARALWGLGGGKAADRTAKATEDTAKGVKKILSIQQAGGLVFTR